MLRLISLISAAALAGLAPLLARGIEKPAPEDGFPGWPAQYEGRALTPLPLSARENQFIQDFPGRVGRFSDGRRELVLRWTTAPTRRLHPAADCFRGAGFTVTPQPAQRSAEGAAMSCFRASRAGEALDVCEHVRDAQGNSWPDAGAWYWHALLGGGGPWWSVVTARRAP
jgi:hypothetical protein